MRRTPLEITSIEYPSSSMTATVDFLAEVCGWKPAVYGTSYASVSGGGVDATVQGDAEEQSATPLMVIRVPDLEEAMTRVRAAGGEVTYGPFDILGGRRFHFREPGGNEMAMWVPAPL